MLVHTISSYSSNKNRTEPWLHAYIWFWWSVFPIGGYEHDNDICYDMASMNAGQWWKYVIWMWCYDWQWITEHVNDVNCMLYMDSDYVMIHMNRQLQQINKKRNEHDIVCMIMICDKWYDYLSTSDIWKAMWWYEYQRSMISEVSMWMSVTHECDEMYEHKVKYVIK